MQFKDNDKIKMNFGLTKIHYLPENDRGQVFMFVYIYIYKKKFKVHFYKLFRIFMLDVMRGVIIIIFYVWFG